MNKIITVIMIISTIFLTGCSGLNVSSLATSSLEPIVKTNCVIPSTTIDFEISDVSSNNMFSLGDGALSFGASSFCNGSITAITGSCAVRGDSLSFSPMVNGVPQAGCMLELINNSYTGAYNSCNISFVQSDIIGLRSNTEVGIWERCVGSLLIVYD